MDLLQLIAALAAYLNLERLGELATRLVQSMGAPDGDNPNPNFSVDAVPLTDAELEELRTLMATVRDTLLDEQRDDGLSDEVLGHLETARQIIVAQAAEETARTEDAANREAERQRLADEINAILNGPPEGEGVEGDGGEGGEGEGAGEGGDGAEGGEGAAGAEGGEGAGDGAPAPQPALAAAGAPAAPAAPARISGVRARRPAANQPRPPEGGRRSVPFTAAGSFGGWEPGAQLDAAGMGAVMEEAVLAGRGYNGPRYRANVGRLAITQWPEERFLTDNARDNARKLDAVVSSRAIAAAGGICAPVAVSLDMPTIGQDDRPVANALARFGAEARGAIATLPPPILGDATDAITIWTHANDRKAAGLDGGSPNPATKPCMRITCPEEEETIVDAIVSCIELGNFELRYFRENADAWQRIMLVEAARVAENKLLGVIDAGSTSVTVAPVLDTIRTVFAALDRATAKYRWLHRDYRVNFRWIAPYNLFFNMRASLVRQMPVGTMDETMALAEATIDRWLTVRGINVTWHKDGLAGQTWSAQGDGVLEGWQDTAQTWLFPEGEWLFLDGGRLDFGVVRDSVLNATNDVQIEFEIFEQAHHHGRDSWELTFDVVPDGSYSAPVDLDLEATGS
jgi:hypothetical protein